MSVIRSRAVAMAPEYEVCHDLILCPSSLISDSGRSVINEEHTRTAFFNNPPPAAIILRKKFKTLC